jgi:type 2 lantibiotic biosynthesis protein LanM
MSLSPTAIHRASSLAERLAGRLAAEHPAAGDGERGERRLARWSGDPPFLEQPELFDRRLAQDGADRAALRGLLGERIGGVRATAEETPSWALALAESFGEENERQPALEPPAQWRGLPSYPFWNFVEKICRRASRRLIDRLERLASPAGLPAGGPEIARVVAGSLPYELFNWPLATLVLEMNVARMRGDLLREDARGRFEEFAAGLAQGPKALAILEEYPVLARQLAELAETWSSSVFEVLERLSRDWQQIAAVFGLDPEDRLTRLHLGAGDRHRGGRSVAILLFRSGRRLVYKPRSLATDLVFQELLQKVNGWGDQPPFKTLAVLDRGSHGWVEHVAPAACGSAEEVRRFYRRQGGYLAILFLLRATDIHYDNVIAQGEHPVIVDLESLLQPGAAAEDSWGDDFLRDSIVEVGLLPVRNWANENSAGLDVSGLGGPDGQLPPRPEPFWAGRGTDQMHLDRQVSEIKLETRHRPKLDGENAPATDHSAEIECGFAAVYRLLAAHRDELLAPDGILARLGRQEVRILLRPTAVYGLMLRESFHPDFLRDALDRDRFFDKLWKQVPPRPILERVIAFEQAALRRGEIPLFTASPASCDLCTDSGDVLAGFFGRPGLEMVEARLRAFGERDLAQQLWFIRASIAILSKVNPEREPARRSAGAAAAPASRERLLELARAAGDHLAASAAEEENSVRWLGLQPTAQRTIKIAPLGANLYSGAAGIALFLGYLGAVTGEGRYSRLAEKAAATMLAGLGKDAETAAKAGAFEGLAGLVYSLFHLAALRPGQGLPAAGRGLLGRLEVAAAADQRLDLLGGGAGAILVLAGLARAGALPLAEVLPLLERCGERLLETARPADGGLGWLTTGESAEPLAGFSHGNAGIAAALAELSALSGRPEFGAAAQQALDYERRLFSPREGNWPDLRVGRDAFDQVNWCHGAPGIGLSRALMLRHRPEDERLREELLAAALTTLSRGFGRGHSLCHGDLGNLDFLLLAAPLLPERGLAAEIARLSGEVAADIAAGGWRCGLPMAVETPGLMVGVAGIGYGLLRLAAPAEVPSVLALGPPAASPPTGKSPG